MKLAFWKSDDTTEAKPKYIRASNGGVFVTIFLMGSAVWYNNTGSWLVLDRATVIRVFLIDLMSALAIFWAYTQKRDGKQYDRDGKRNLPAILLMLMLVVAGIGFIVNQLVEQSSQHEAILIIMITVFVCHWLQLHRYIMEVVDKPVTIPNGDESPT